MVEMTRKQPTGNDGYEITRFNALRHHVDARDGNRLRETLL
jgi:hypothetical protein